MTDHGDYDDNANNVACTCGIMLLIISSTFVMLLLINPYWITYRDTNYVEHVNIPVFLFVWAALSLFVLFIMELYMADC